MPVSSKSHIGQTSTSREAAAAAPPAIKGKARQDELTSSSSAPQHTSSTPSNAHSLPAPAPPAPNEPSLTSLSRLQGHPLSSLSPSSTTPSSAVADEDGRMCDVSTSKRARELTSGSPISTASGLGGHVHSSRQHLFPSSIHHQVEDEGEEEDGKQEADPSNGQDKRRRTVEPPISSPNTSPITTSELESLTMSAENRQLRLETTALRARLVMVEAQLARLQQLFGTTTTPTIPPPSTPAQSSAAPSPMASDVDMTTSAQQTQSIIPAEQPSSSLSAHKSSSPPTQKSKPKAAAALRGRTVEPTTEQLQRAGLTAFSSTDLVLTIQYAPASSGVMRRRLHFPNHLTASKEVCITVGNQLQDGKGLQIAPPRIPAFIVQTPNLLGGDINLQMAALQPNSREYHYLQQMQLASQNGDHFDLQQHSFPDAECVSSWSMLLTQATQAYHPAVGNLNNPDEQKVVIHLGFTHQLIKEAAQYTFAAHARRIKDERQDRGGSTSPTPSTASTGSDRSLSSVNGSPEATSATSPSLHDRRPRLSACALDSNATVADFAQRYVCVSVSNWPREHATELCRSNEHLAAFLRLRAPHLRLLTHQEHGTTSSSTIVICQQQHLTELQRLQGQISPDHGISKPLNLNSAVHMMGAQTCTFCWAPGHGSHRCPQRTRAPSPGLSPPHQAACRVCYSFDHHTPACRHSAPVTCKLCELPGHATHACQYFRPSRRSLRDFLGPATPTGSRQAQGAAGGPPHPAPILSAAQSSAPHAWQQVPSTSPPAMLSASVPATAVMAQVAQLQAFVTQQQLQSALLPILSLLQQIQLSFLNPPLKPSCSSSSSSPFDIYAPVATSTHVNGQ